MGRLRCRGSDGGWFLLDVLVALVVVLVGFGVFLGGISMAGQLARRQEARVQGMIEQRNANARDFTVVFQKE